MDDNAAIFLWCLLFGTMLVALEILYVKWNIARMEQRIVKLLVSIGFTSESPHHDYIKLVSNYVILVNLLPKERMFQKHTLRIGVNFEIPWSYDVLDESLEKLKKQYEDYQWYNGSVHYNITFDIFIRNMDNLINFRINETLAILKKHELNPITFQGAEKQYRSIDDFRNACKDGNT